MLRAFAIALCLWGGVAVTPTLGAVATSKVALNAATWTDLGAGPLTLGASGRIVFAIGDVTPTIPVGQGFVPRINQVVNTASHVWAMSGDGFAGSVFVSPIVGKGGVSIPSTWSTADAAITTATLSNGNMTVRGISGSWVVTRITQGKTSGKLYVEFLINTNNAYDSFGLAVGGAMNLGTPLGNFFADTAGGAGPGPTSVVGAHGGFVINYSISETAATNDVWALAVDFGAANAWISRNNVWVNGSNPVTGTLPVMSFVTVMARPFSTQPLFAAITEGNGSTITLKAKGSSQTYAPPSGFSAWDGP